MNGRNIIVVMYGFIWLTVIFASVQGVEMGFETWQWAMIITATATLPLLWLPYKYFMKVPAFRKFDKVLWRSKILSSLYRAMVGKKEKEQDYLEFLRATKNDK